MILLTVAGCGSGEGAGEDSAPGDAASRVERCVERFLERAASDDVAEADVRRYAESAYCTPFEREGWITRTGP